MKKNNPKSFFNLEIPSSSTLEFATLAITVYYGSIIETATKVIVIAQREKLTVDFIPETGYFVPGVVNKIYF